MTHDMANKMNEILGMITRPLYLVNFPISRNTSLPSCTANTIDPIRASLSAKHHLNPKLDQRGNIIVRFLNWKLEHQ